MKNKLEAESCFLIMVELIPQPRFWLRLLSNCTIMYAAFWNMFFEPKEEGKRILRKFSTNYTAGYIFVCNLGYQDPDFT